MCSLHTCKNFLLLLKLRPRKQCCGSGSKSGFGTTGPTVWASRLRIGSESYYHQAKKRKKNLNSYCFVTFFYFSFENDVHVPSKSNKQNFFFFNQVFFGILGRSMTKIAPDPHPDPDPLVRGMDPRIQIRIRIHPKMSWIRNTERKYRSQLSSFFDSLRS